MANCARYDINRIEQKYANKEALRARFWLRKDFKPIIAYVGRLDAQKGIHLIRHALFCALRNGAQCVLLGPSSENGINEQFCSLKRELKDNADCHLELGFSEELVHLICAGADRSSCPASSSPAA